MCTHNPSHIGGISREKYKKNLTKCINTFLMTHRTIRYDDRTPVLGFFVKLVVIHLGIIYVISCVYLFCFVFFWERPLKSPMIHKMSPPGNLPIVLF